MKTYYAKINRETYTAEYTVKAESAEEAKQKIKEICHEITFTVHEK